MITADLIIKTVCEALKLDRDKLLSDKSIRRADYIEKYAPAKQIAAYLIREKVLTKKTTKSYGINPRQITYNEMTGVFNRKSHYIIMAWELDCKLRLRNDPDFVNKYNMVVNLLDKNTNIA